MIGTVLSKLRNNKGYTQEEVAEALNVKRARYNSWENDIAKPDLDMVKKMAQFFNVTTDYLLGFTDDTSYTIQGYVDSHFDQMGSEFEKNKDRENKIDLFEKISQDPCVPTELPSLLEDLKTTQDKYSKLVDLKYKHDYVKEAIIKEEQTIYEIDNKIIEIPIIKLPTFGSISIEENIIGFIPLPFKIIKSVGEKIFCLEVNNNSMTDVGINNGDIILVNFQKHAETGQTVIARVKSEIMCKRFYKVNETCRLEPANKNIIPTGYQHIEIIGVVKKIIKDIY